MSSCIPISSSYSIVQLVSNLIEHYFDRYHVMHRTFSFLPQRLIIPNLTLGGGSHMQQMREQT